MCISFFLFVLYFDLGLHFLEIKVFVPGRCLVEDTATAGTVASTSTANISIIEAGSFVHTTLRMYPE